MHDLTDGQLAALLVGKCGMSINEVVDFFKAREDVRAMAPPVSEEPIATRDTVPDSKGNTLKIGVCFVEEAAE